MDTPGSVLESLERFQPNQARWECKSRQTFYQWAGLTEGAPIPDRIKSEMPACGVGDEFHYELMGCDFPATWRQTIYSSLPRTNSRYLTLGQEGTMRLSSEPLLEQPHYHLILELSPLCGLFDERFDCRYNSEGKEIFLKMVNEWDKLLAAQGLLPAHRDTLGTLLSRARGELKRNKLVLDHWRGHST
jgi:hypothetical protein